MYALTRALSHMPAPTTALLPAIALAPHRTTFESTSHRSLTSTLPTLTTTTTLIHFTVAFAVVTNPSDWLAVT